MKKMFLDTIMSINQKNINTNGISQTNKYQKSSLLFLQRHDNLKDFESGLLKIGKKHQKGINIYYIGYIKIEKIDDCGSIYSVNPLYLGINHASGQIKEKNENNSLVLFNDSVNENREIFKKYAEFEVELNTKSKQ